MVKLAFLGINAEVLFRKLGETDDNEIEGIAKYQKLNTNQIPTENDGKESCNYQSSEVQQPYLDESEIERSEQTIESLRLPESSDNQLQSEQTAKILETNNIPSDIDNVATSHTTTFSHTSTQVPKNDGSSFYYKEQNNLYFNPFPPYNEYPKQSDRRNNESKHTKNHLNNKEHKCDLCPFSSAFKSNLSAHVKGVHEHIKNFNCEQCQYSATTKRDIDKHVKGVHFNFKSSLSLL